MQWNRSQTIGLAKPHCVHCHGYGLRIIRQGLEVPCNCVFRVVFRICYNRFRECVVREHHMSTVTLEFCRGTEGRRAYSRKSEEYMADFALVSRRALDPHEYRIFRYHFLLGANWRLCTRQMKIDRGTFFHTVYRIEHKLGRVYAELEPYPLYPVDEYFGGAIRKEALSEVRASEPPVRIRRPHRTRNLEFPLPRTA